MAVIRGRAITTFGGLFTALGLDGGSAAAPPAAVSGNRIVIVQAEFRATILSGESRIIRVLESPRIDRVT